MLKKVFTISLFVLTQGFLANAQTLNKAKIDSFTNVLAINNKAMGSLAVLQNGTVYQKAFGNALISSDNKIAANAHTRYRIGSISKMFTGVLIFQLIEEGKLNLATKLALFYPQMPNAANITIAQLLGHRTGLFNITNAPDFVSYMTSPQTHGQLLAKMAVLKPNFEPGAKYEYSNTNFILLAYIAEKLTNKPYAELVKQRITNKIGLKETYYGAKINSTDNEALSYNFNSQWTELPQTDMSIPSGAGAMVSTPTDLVKFIEALFTGKLISKASLEQMKPVKEDYGLAMRKTVFEDHTGYGHNGAIDGFRSELVYFPAERVAVAYISNGGNYGSSGVLKGLLNIVFNKPFTIPTFTILTLTPAELDKYTGVYSSPDFPLKITVSKDGSKLFGQASGQSPLLLSAVAKDTFEFEPADIHLEFDPQNGRFTLKQRGKITVFTKE